MTKKPAFDLLGWAALVAALAVTMSAEYALARACGFGQYVAAGVPAALDIYAVRALRARRDVPVVVVAMIAVNALSHLVAAGILAVSWLLVVAVSAIAPLVVWRVHRLSEHSPAAVGTEPAVSPNTEQAEGNTGTEQANGHDDGEVFAPVYAERSEVFAPVAVDSAPAAPVLVSEANTGEQAEADTEHEEPEAEQAQPEQQEETEQAEASPAPARLTTEQAREVVEQCWANGLGVRETARRATRSPSTVTGMFARLEKERGPQPSPGQLALVK